MSRVHRNKIRKSRKSIQARGRVTINLVSSGLGGIQVTVARSCNRPEVLKLLGLVLGEIARQHPGIIIKEVEPEVPPSAFLRKRGGPIGKPENQRIEIVKGWFKVQGQIREVDYARSCGISPATLRRWTRALLQTGKL